MQKILQNAHTIKHYEAPISGVLISFMVEPSVHSHMTFNNPHR